MIHSVETTAAAKDETQYARTMYVLDLIAAERARQCELHHRGLLTEDPADPNTDFDATLRVLMEEVGECAAEVDGIKNLRRRLPQTATLGGRLDNRLRKLAMELVQVAAIATAAREAIELQLGERSLRP